MFSILAKLLFTKSNLSNEKKTFNSMNILRTQRRKGEKTKREDDCYYQDAFFPFIDLSLSVSICPAANCRLNISYSRF